MSRSQEEASLQTVILERWHPGCDLGGQELHRHWREQVKVESFQRSIWPCESQTDDRQTDSASMLH